MLGLGPPHVCWIEIIELVFEKKNNREKKGLNFENFFFIKNKLKR